MYEWRRMTPEERKEVLAARQHSGRPWHRPPHFDFGEGAYLLSAACYQHSPIIGASAERIAEFEQSLLAFLEQHAREVHAWCVLPNHYHALADASNVKGLLAVLG